jgi:hypothetical protein
MLKKKNEKGQVSLFMIILRKSQYMYWFSNL